MLSKVRECLATKEGKHFVSLSGEKIETNSVNFVLKHLAYDTFVNLKIEPRKYVKYVKNDVGHRIKETTSL